MKTITQRKQTTKMRIEVLQEMCEYEVVSLIFERDRELVSSLSYMQHCNSHSSMHTCTYILACAQFLSYKNLNRLLTVY